MYNSGINLVWACVVLRGGGGGDIISSKCIYEKKRNDGWSMVRSKRWLIGYTFHHQKSYVVPTLGQPYQPNGWVAHFVSTWGERWHANCDIRPTMPTMYQRWINILLLTGYKSSEKNS